MNKLLLFLFIYLGSILPTPYAQEEPFVTGYHRLSSPRIYLGLPFDLHLFFPIEYHHQAELNIPIDFPGQNLELISGPHIRIHRVDQRSGVEYIYRLRSSRAGTIAMDSFSLRSINQHSRTRPFHIEIFSIENQSVMPHLVWEGIPQQLYQGESVQIELMLYHTQPDWSVGRISALQLRGALVESIHSSPMPRILEQNRISLGRWILFAAQTGVIEIAPIELQVGEITIRTPLKQLPVQALPANAPASFHPNTIGAFSLRLLTESPSADEIIRARVQLSGEGSLHLIAPPALEFQGATLLSREELSLIQPTRYGYGGLRENIYLLLLHNFEESSLSLPAFSWFNPRHSRYYEQESYQVVLDSQEFLNEENPIKLALLPMHGRIGRNGLLQLHSYLIGYVVLLTVWLSLFIFNRKKKQQKIRFFSSIIPYLSLLLFLPVEWPNYTNIHHALAEEALLHEDWQRALEHLKLLAEDHTEYRQVKPIIFYNQAIAYHELGDYVQKRFYLLKSAKLAPISPFYHQTLRDLGIAEFIPNRVLIYQLYLLFYWLSWVILVLFFYQILRKNLTLKKIMLYLLLISFILGSHLWQLHRRVSPIGVVNQDIKIRRIPDVNATLGELLVAGEILYLGGQWQEYIQVTNRYNKEGWILRDDILIIKRH